MGTKRQSPHKMHKHRAKLFEYWSADPANVERSFRWTANVPENVSPAESASISRFASSREVCAGVTSRIFFPRVSSLVHP